MLRWSTNRLRTRSCRSERSGARRRLARGAVASEASARREVGARSAPRSEPGDIVSVALVTGSAGLIGSEAVRHFAGLGLDVVGIENDMRQEFFGAEASTAWHVRGA